MSIDSRPDIGQYQKLPQDLPPTDSTVKAEQSNVLTYTCFDMSSQCTLNGYENICNCRLYNIIDKIFYGSGDVGKELLDKVDDLCTQTGAKIKFVQPTDNNTPDNQYLFSHSQFKHNEKIIYIKIPIKEPTERDIYIYDHGASDNNNKIRRITLKNGDKIEGQKAIWLQNKITVEGYIVAHELSHAATYLACHKKNEQWNEHKNDISAILKQCKIEPNNKMSEIINRFFSNAEEARNAILGKKFEAIPIPGECDFFKEITSKNYILLHQGQEPDGNKIKPTQEELDFLSRIFDYVNTPPDCPCCSTCLIV